MKKDHQIQQLKWRFLDALQKEIENDDIPDDIIVAALLAATQDVVNQLHNENQKRN